MTRFIICYLFVWFVFSTLGGCRTPQHRNLDRIEHSPYYNLKNGGFEGRRRVDQFDDFILGHGPRYFDPDPLGNTDPPPFAVPAEGGGYVGRAPWIGYVIPPSNEESSQWGGIYGETKPKSFLEGLYTTPITEDDAPPERFDGALYDPVYTKEICRDHAGTGILDARLYCRNLRDDDEVGYSILIGGVGFSF